MIHERMARGATALLLAAAAAFAACGDDPLTPNENYCSRLCECNKCSDAEKQSCLDDIKNLESDASDKGCSDAFGTLVTCLNGSASCVDGDYDLSVCNAEQTDVDDCIKPPPPACATKADGVCDEPEGTGKCAEGTDATDCAPACPFTNDGICNEPDPAGDGLCDPGTDTVDCGSTCRKCFAFFQDPTLGNACSTSETVILDLLDCACASCSSSCASGIDVCDGQPVTSTCVTCASELCTTAYNACINDQ